jgi:hypothetical protein
MKKLENLGRVLNKEEQKKIIGGRIAVCTCNGSDMDTVVCACVGFTQCFNCNVAAAQYCTSQGYRGVTCDFA